MELYEFNKEIIKSIKDEDLKIRKQPLSGRLFISMSKKQAIDKLLNLWNLWDSKDKKLPRGYGVWIDIFKQTKTIRKWDIQDRLRETGIIEYWKEEVEIKKGTASKIIFDIEIWYINNAEERNRIKNKIIDLISQENGHVITECLIEDIRFNAIKVELPIENVERVLDKNYTKLFSCDNIMFFYPVGQCKFGLVSESLESNLEPGNTSGEPIAAIFDSIPFYNHVLLQNRLIIDDPDDFESEYKIHLNNRSHGTAMASLICHGELDLKEKPLERPVYFRPIMKPNPDDLFHSECIPKYYFIEDLIERSVRRIFEGENNETPLYPAIKVINLSIADRIKMYFNKLSSCARLLDWLSNKYQVLFCVSAGNIESEINLGKSIIELKSFSADELLNHTVIKIDNDIRNRRILSPGESINSLTIGSIHSDGSIIEELGNRFDILPNQNLPSPISAHGLGFKNSIKPELYLPGGRQLFDVTGDNIYKLSVLGIAPGQLVASSPVTSGERNRCVYTCGTSNSTALATRSVVQIYEMLNTLMLENNLKIDEDNIAVILKSLFIHSAIWGEGCDILESILKTDDNIGNFKKVLSRYMGFGIPNIFRVLECTSQRATVIGYGKIKKDEKHVFRFPLPPSLSGTNVMRKLIYTLAWFSPINPANRKYRKANLSVEPTLKEIGVDRINSDWQQVKNGTVQHEVLEGKRVISYEDGESLEISVICREDAENLYEEIPYGIIVTLEISERVELPIYEEIKARITIPIKIEEKI